MCLHHGPSAQEESEIYGSGETAFPVGDDILDLVTRKKLLNSKPSDPGLLLLLMMSYRISAAPSGPDF